MSLYIFLILLTHSSKLFTAQKCTENDSPLTILITSDITSVAVQNADGGREKKENRKTS